MWLQYYFSLFNCSSFLNFPCVKKTISQLLQFIEQHPKSLLSKSNSKSKCSTFLILSNSFTTLFNPYLFLIYFTLIDHCHTPDNIFSHCCGVLFVLLLCSSYTIPSFFSCYYLFSSHDVVLFFLLLPLLFSCYCLTLLTFVPFAFFALLPLPFSHSYIILLALLPCFSHIAAPRFVIDLQIPANLALGIALVVLLLLLFPWLVWYFPSPPCHV